MKSFIASEILQSPAHDKPRTVKQQIRFSKRAGSVGRIVQCDDLCTGSADCTGVFRSFLSINWAWLPVHIGQRGRSSACGTE